MKKYPEYKKLNLPQIGKEINAFWKEAGIFEKSVSTREGQAPFVFYEGPPSANGMPGIHHVMARAIKDIFCRYQTLNGKQVKRKAGWDTHGLPIELAVEKTLGIKKEDIGTKISVEDYNKACRKEVMKYTDKWEELTDVMGYWVDMSDPYITYDNKYIESVWWLLKDLYNKNLLYKGYTIQPYSPAAGTGLSSHELNQPGCYKNVKDTSATAMFKVKNKQFLDGGDSDTYFLAWTTTPWTLPSNTALAVGARIEYALLNTYNPYSGKVVQLFLAKELISKYFKPEGIEADFDAYKLGDKILPYRIAGTFMGKDLVGTKYEQLLPFEANKSVELNGKTLPFEEAGGTVIAGDFVTTEDGTGIVHIAPSFGADDYNVAKKNNIGSLTLVDKRGKFLPEVKDDLFLYGEEYVKEAYLNEEEKEQELTIQKEKLSGFIKDTSKLKYLSVDERIVLKLQNEDKLFKKEKYEHNYPHCWRTDKPILYYPLDSWFIKVTAQKDRMIELNNTINWKPASTGTGRFGNWLENANDWNLSRSRFWGIPLPLWRTQDGKEEICVGSAEELKAEIDRSVKAGFMDQNPLAEFLPGNFDEKNYKCFDLHKPYADNIILCSPNGEKMYREADLIDVWFDSGSMPYAQLHYPFENKDLIDKHLQYPADFIAEGVDQTRGWFYTLHAIATLCFNSVAYKNVVSNGLVLDKNGSKMSKRLGNAVDPFETISKYGADATRWYMIANAAPWDNLKFDVNGIVEVQRKLFGTLYNTYNFFALYANIDGFVMNEMNVERNEDKTELDRWIISKLQSLVQEVSAHYNNYEPHNAARAIEEFVDEHLSNWYVRLSRRRFWKPAGTGADMVELFDGAKISKDKKQAYETLYECLNVVAQLMSPIAPFFAEWMYQNTTSNIKEMAIANKTPLAPESIHLTLLTQFDVDRQDKKLEEKMELAQKVTSMILSIRKKENIRVRQPLNKVQIPVIDERIGEHIKAVEDLIKSEVNVKQLELVDENTVEIVKNLKLNFKTLGKKCGKFMKAVQQYAQGNPKVIIEDIEKNKEHKIQLEGTEIVLLEEDVEIVAVDIPGWKVANQGNLTVALDITLSDELLEEGIARELINRIQNLRKDKAFEVTDKINLKIQSNAFIDSAVSKNLNYICAETLASSLELVDSIDPQEGAMVEVNDEVKTLISITKFN